jgi:predicted amidohydrolase
MNVMKGHANGVYVAAANRIGLENIYLLQTESILGHSFIAGPREKFWHKASHDKEEILVLS